MKALFAASILSLFCLTACHTTQKPAADQARRLIHLVFLDLREDLSPAQRDTFVNTLRSLKSIREIQDLQINTFQNLGDLRAMGQYELLFQTTFKNEADYQLYQQHPQHIQARESMKSYLAAPPATYDYYLY
ncbi:MAG TPA: Dabb family protein [Saprospiraceae bacterium]|nr:Dabb family protein [Saprospiraceae bacterium]HMQ82009.1 Dabb family protein [Saprospiraceae bacterium]